MHMRVITKHAIVGVENSMGARSSLEFWIPTGKALNRFPCCFKQKIVTGSLFCPK